MQLAEKQKAKYTYGILERQFSNLYKKASRAKGVTGEVLLQYCESRLDNVVYRMGIGQTRRQARQLVNHRHIEVNGHILNIPSYSVRAGDVISVREKSRDMEVIKDALRSDRHRHFEWLEWNSETQEGKFIAVPEREQIPENIKEQLIVELYSK